MRRQHFLGAIVLSESFSCQPRERAHAVRIQQQPDGVEEVRLVGPDHAARQLSDLGLVRANCISSAMTSGSQTASEFSRKIQSPFAAAKPTLLPRANPSFLGSGRPPAGRRSAARPARREPSVEALSTRITSSAGQVCAKSEASASCEHRAAVPVDDDGADDRRGHALIAWSAGRAARVSG